MQSVFVVGLCCLLASAYAGQAPSLKTIQRAIINMVNLNRLAEGGTEKPLPKDAVLQTLSEDLYRLDQQNNAAVANQQWAVNTYSQNGKLFTKLDQTVFAKPTYKAFIALLDNYVPLLGVAETVTAQERTEEAAFLDAIMVTPVMMKAHAYLVSKGLVKPDVAQFKKFLQMIWFTVYQRRGAPDTSGFEHVFVGELQENGADVSTIGLHNWVQYATQEQKGKIVYKAYKGKADPNMFGMQFLWNDKLKYMSTIAIGESPEMSMAVNTVCFLVAPNNECKLKMGGAPVSILSYRWDTKNATQFYVASAYYNL